MHPSERQRLSDRLRGVMAGNHLTESTVARAISVDQPFISRLLDCRYEFETPKVARVLAYVNIQIRSKEPEQIELPFETTLALNRFAQSKGDFDLLNSLINVLATRAAR